jgi:hypothetical protein
MNEHDENQRPTQIGTERNLSSEVDAYQRLYELATQLKEDRGLTTAQLLGLVHVLAADLAQEVANACRKTTD